MSMLDEKISLSANVTADARGLDLLRIYVTMNRAGYPKYARVNAEGGLTFIGTRDGNVAPSYPTLVLSREEAQLIATSLMNYLYGPGWGYARERVPELENLLAVSEKENRFMRAKKKELETELTEAQTAIHHLTDVKNRHDEVIVLIRALSGTILPATAETDTDCE